MTKFLYFLLVIFNIFAQGVFSQNNLSERVSLTMVAEERTEGLILVCTLENKDSIGFYTALFRSSGNSIIIKDSLGKQFNGAFIYCGIDPSILYVPPFSTRTNEFNLSSYFSEAQAYNIRRGGIPEGKYNVYWELYNKSVCQKVRSRVIKYDFKRFPKK